MYASLGASMAGLYGPLHGRANQECLEFLDACGTDDPEKVEAFVRASQVRAANEAALARATARAV
jgi:citrate synthase